MNSAVGQDALTFIDSLLTPKEIAGSYLRVAMIGKLINARKVIKSKEVRGIKRCKTLAIVPLNNK